MNLFTGRATHLGGMLPVSSRFVQRIVTVLTALTLAMAPIPLTAREFRIRRSELDRFLRERETVKDTD